MLSWQRIIYYLGLALVESTPAALLLTSAGADAWGVLIGVVLLGALADWIVLRRLPPERQTLALAAGGLLCALWALAFWAFIGGVITRTAAVSFARQENLAWGKAGGFAQSLEPSWLDYAAHNHGLGLLWSAAGLLWGISTWLRKQFGDAV